MTEKNRSNEISIIIVNYNTRELLRGCLTSIFQQLAAIDAEVIVVDNASKDQSQEMVKQDFPSVILLESPQNLGFAKANNLGIKQSSGRYLALINSDIVVLDDCLRQLIHFMDANPTVGMTGPRILNPDKTLQPSCRHFPSIWNNMCQIFGLNKIFRNSAIFSDPFMTYWQHDQIRDIDVLTGCFWVIRREALEEVGLLDEIFFIYGEDVDWCRRFHNVGWDICFYPNARAIHYKGASSASAPIRWFLERQKADLQYWKKHHGQFGQASYALIIFLRHLVRLIAFSIAYPIKTGNRIEIKHKIQIHFACLQWLLGLRTFDSE